MSDEGLRRAAQDLAEAVERYLDPSRSPATWATDRSNLWQAGKDVLAALAARSEPRGEGLREGINPEIDAMLASVDADTARAVWLGMSMPGSIEDDIAALPADMAFAATPPAPALDVVALYGVITDEMLNDGPDDTVYDVAARITARAREYAALAPERQ